MSDIERMTPPALRKYSPGLAGALLAVSLSCCLLSPAPALAAGAAVGKATYQQKNQAKKHYRSAMKDFEGERYEKALKGFHASYDAVASPNSHLMIARVQIKMGDLLEAHAELLLVIDEAADAAKIAKKYAKTLEAANHEFDELKAKIAIVKPSVGVELQLDDETIESADWGKARVVSPGSHTYTLRTDDGRETRISFEAKAGSETLTHLSVPKPNAETVVAAPNSDNTPPHAELKTLSYISAGVGVAGLATFGIFGYMNNQVSDDLESSCPGRRCQGHQWEDAEDGRLYQTVANVGLGGGLIGIGTATVLWFRHNCSASASLTTNPKSDKAKDQDMPSIAFGPRAVSVWGQF